MNDTTTNQSKDHDFPDTDWVAFEYLAGELSDDAVAQFESRLASDQSAREALARTVELTQAVAMVESTAGEVTSNDGAAGGTTRVAAMASIQTRSPTAWLAPAAWLVVAALACVAFVLFMNPGKQTSRWSFGPDTVAVTDDQPVDSGELASLWVDTGEFLVSVSQPMPSDSLNDFLDDDFSESFAASEGDAEDFDRLAAPSWMMAALAGSSDREMQE